MEKVFDLHKVARSNILELTPYRCARDVRTAMFWEMYFFLLIPDSYVNLFTIITFPCRIIAMEFSWMLMRIVWDQLSQVMNISLLTGTE
jgi:hypothetical protein